jgi:hypothetical protein
MVKIKKKGFSKALTWIVAAFIVAGVAGIGVRIALAAPDNGSETKIYVPNGTYDRNDTVTFQGAVNTYGMMRVDDLHYCVLGFLDGIGPARTVDQWIHSYESDSGGFSLGKDYENATLSAPTGTDADSSSNGARHLQATVKFNQLGLMATEFFFYCSEHPPGQGGLGGGIGGKTDNTVSNIIRYDEYGQGAFYVPGALAVPQNLKGEFQEPNKVVVTWNKLNTATEYRVSGACMHEGSLSTPQVVTTASTSVTFTTDPVYCTGFDMKVIPSSPEYPFPASMTATAFLSLTNGNGNTNPGGNNNGTTEPGGNSNNSTGTGTGNTNTNTNTNSNGNNGNNSTKDSSIPGVPNTGVAL